MLFGIACESICLLAGHSFSTSATFGRDSDGGTPRYLNALRHQPQMDILDHPVVKVVAAVLFFGGQVVTLSSMYALGITGMSKTPHLEITCHFLVLIVLLTLVG